MRKEVIGQKTVAEKGEPAAEWLDLVSIARVQLTSEDPAFPVENALSRNPEHNKVGWRATSPGPQTLTFLFDKPQTIRRVLLHFMEDKIERSQEFVLRYS